MLNLYVTETTSKAKIPVYVDDATNIDFLSTKGWQTNWTSKYARSLPNKVALHRCDDNELLGLMSYVSDGSIFAVEIIYIESASHSNANLLHIAGVEKKYIGIAKALLAYAVQISKNDGYDGVLVLKAKATELADYYQREFGAKHAGAYDPFRFIIWEDEAEEILSQYREVT